MRKIYSISGNLILSAAVVLMMAGCEKGAMDNPGDKNGQAKDKPSDPVETGAGSGFTVPNTFDASGLLLVKGDEMNQQNPGTPMELWMGVGNEKAGTLVGKVTFTESSVVIDLTDVDGKPGPDMFPYVVTEVHIHFASSIEEIPHAQNGNPIPGQFEYNVKVPADQSDITVPVTFDKVGAIHLSVAILGGIQGFNYYLPSGPVQMEIIDYPSAGDPSYFLVKVINAGFISDYDMRLGYGAGVYEGWCIDVDHTITLNQTYDAYLYSSYEQLPAWLTGPGKIENTQELDKINYLINRFKTGDFVTPLNSDGSPAGVEEQITFSDIQRAIWHYIDDNQSTSGLSAWKQTRVNAIIAEVDKNGEGFIPSCSQKIVFLVVPTNTNENYNVQVVIGQPVIGATPVPCETVSGTAWGDGKYGAGFPGAKQWGTYFEYTDTPSLPAGN